MTVSVIVCTYNRCRSLASALESIACSHFPGSVPWEILVIENNSRDETRDVAAEFQRRYPGRFRYIFEPQQGKSYALNTGVREARGEILAFMDDDVTVDSYWLQRLTAVLEDGTWAGVGGRIVPPKGFVPPSWLSLHYKYALAPLAFFDLGTECCELHESPFGTNMAFRREAFEKIGGFRVDLGPCPGSEIRGEDTEFGCRALSSGMRLWYEPSAVVYHSLPEERLKKEYFLAWWHDKGRSHVRQNGIPSNRKWSFAGAPIHLFRQLCTSSLRWMWTFERAKRFSHKLMAWCVLGMIKEHRHLSLVKHSANVSKVCL